MGGRRGGKDDMIIVCLGEKIYIKLIFYSLYYLKLMIKKEITLTPFISFLPKTSQVVTI